MRLQQSASRFLTALFLAPSALALEAVPSGMTSTNHVEIGVGHVSESDDRFGRYNGLEDKGFFAVLGLEYLHRPAFDADRADFWSVMIRDAGLDNRRFEAQLGRQGRYRVDVRYRERSARHGSGSTIYSPGSSQLLLPPDWVPAGTTADMSGLLPSLTEIRQFQDRRELGLAGKIHLNRQWTFSSAVRQEERDGTHLVAGHFGNTGGNPRAAFLPAPIDYRTRHVDAELAWARKDRQIRAAYHASLFSNNQPSVSFANPFSTIGGWAEGSGFPDGRGELALAPDNQFHQLSLGGRWQLRPRLSVLADFAIGRLQQDEEFLAYTTNPILAQSVVQPLPADGLNGRIDTTTLNLRLNGQFRSNGRWTLSYRLDDRDNRTPGLELVGIGADSQTQDVSETSSRRRYNLPYDYRDQRLRLDTRWTWANRTRLTVAASQRRIDRSLTARDRTDETRLDAQLGRPVLDWLELGIKASWSERDGSTYNGASGFLASHDPGYTDTLANQWVNLPTLRHFHLADRRRTRVGVHANLTPSPAWNLNVEAATLAQRYQHSEVGLTDSGADQLSAHLGWAPARNVRAHAFISLERLDSDQSGFSFRGGGNQASDLNNPERFWRVAHEDRILTSGAGFQRSFFDDRLDLRADVVFARATAELDITTGSALSSEPLPDISNRLRSIMIRLDYRLTKATTLKLSFWNEDFRVRDWALDGVEVNQLGNVILPGESSPDYNVNIFSAALRYRFR